MIRGASGAKVPGFVNYFEFSQQAAKSCHSSENR
jgi:hypothetical protein